jgi:type VI secretion system protein ImpA
MSTEATLDFEALLAPISDEAPSGPSLREHPELSRTYYSVREARNMAMEAERALARLALMEQSDFDRELGGKEEARPVPNWGKAADMASDLLCQHSKDLWAVSWLIEAATRQAGVAGFRDGIKLCRLMSEKFWDTIHPRPDEEEGYAHTVAQLSGLDNTLSAPLEASPMLLSNDRISWTNYQYALDLDQMDPERRATRIDEGAVSSDEFNKAIRTADRNELLCTQADLSEAIGELKLFSETMDRLCGKDESGYPVGPPTSNLSQTLTRMLQNFNVVTAGLLSTEQAGSQPLAGQPQSGELTDTSGNHAPTGNLMQRPVASRDEALQHLLRVADYFRKAEPHSPVSYALEQAVRWGRMPLPDLLKDLVSDESVLHEVFKRMGISRPDDSSE